MTTAAPAVLGNSIVQHLRSSRAGARPGDGTLRSMLDGEIFINEADGVFITLAANGAPLTFGTLAAAQAAAATAIGAAIGGLAKVASSGAYGDLTGTPNIAALAPLASPALTGTPTAPANPLASNGTAVAVTSDIEGKLARGVATPNSLTFSGGPALRSLANRAGDRPDMRDYLGFDTSGNNDNADLMIAASIDSGANGYEINIPAGIIALTKTIVNSGFSMRFKGQGNTYGVANNSPGANTRGPGTWLHFAHPNIGVQTIGQPGSSFRKLGTFRDQPIPTPDGTTAWAPGNFDFDFNFQSADVVFEDIMLLNPTKGFSVSGGGSRLYANRIHGHPMMQGANIQQSYDTNRITNVNWWPYWSFDPRVALYTIQNFFGFIVGRADNMFMESIFCIQHYVALWLISTATDANNPQGLPGGSPYSLSVRRLEADVGLMALLVDSGVSGATVNLSGGYVQGYQGECSLYPEANATVFPGLVTVSGSDNRISISQQSILQAPAAHVYVGDGGNAVDLINPLLGTFNNHSGEATQGLTAAGSSKGSVYQGRLAPGYTSAGTMVGPGFTSNTCDF